MKSRRRQRSTGPSRDRWVIPYADFVTLLFAFFTALYAVTSADPGKLPSVAASVREAVSGGDGVLEGGRQPLAGGDKSLEPEDIREAIERELRDDLSAQRLELIEDRRGLVLAIPEAFSFDNGSADLSQQAESLMNRIGKVLLGAPNGVRVEGHTDNTPIRTDRFASNWELSTARATRVVAYFVASAGIPADRLSAAGYSEFHPRADNASPDGRARNRRVDIVILNVATERAEEPRSPIPDP